MAAMEINMLMTIMEFAIDCIQSVGEFGIGCVHMGGWFSLYDNQGGEENSYLYDKSKILRQY